MTRRRSSEEGSTLLLTIFFSALALVIILVVVAATSLYLERKRLYTLADGAALAGAEAYDLDAVKASGGELRPTLEREDVRKAVTDYVGDVSTDEFRGLIVERATTDDGRSASVELSAWWSPPVVSLFVPKAIRIEVTSVARSVFD
jgi:hypothetical protein